MPRLEGSMRVPTFAPLLLFCGCPDPSAPAEGGASSTPVVEVGAPADAAAAPTPPPAQPPGDTSPAFVVLDGAGVKLSGSISYAGKKTGKFHIDFVEPPTPGHFPKLVHSLLVEKAGEWEIEVPKGYGKIGVVGYLDVAGDGPSDGDPAVRIPGLVEIGDSAITGLDLACSDSPDLGEFTPGLGAAPAAPEAAPGEEAPAPTADASVPVPETEADTPTGMEGGSSKGSGPH